ncbi:PREDICTED: uncharacterized protein LOC104605015 [Nelumbo nucifera]|nr:PREDICTED: uncharacterized protein LOC104605015 [Nelumbo nucifera]
MSLVTKDVIANAEVYYGDEICREKFKWLLKEIGLPNSIVPVRDVEECGYVRETGFVWLKQKQKIEYKYEKVGRLVSYATEVTAYVEPYRIKKLTGVKTKELLVWFTLTDICLNPNTGKINFKTSTGLSKSFPASAFEMDEVPEPEAKETKEVMEVKEGKLILV